MLNLLMLLVGGSGVGGSGVAIVDSPTRLGTMHRVAKVGDTVVITDTLKGYDGSAQDLPSGSSVVFNLKGPDGTLLVNRAPVTIRQSGAGDAASKKGGVTVRIASSVGLPAGISTYEFEATLSDGTVLTFPDDVNAELTVIPQIG